MGGTLSDSRSPVSRRDKTSLEAAHQERETRAILEGFESLAETESE
jgi:hypothetical protein